MQRTTHAAIIIFERKPVQMNHSVFSRKFLVGKLTLLVVLYGLVFTSCEVIVDFGLKDATFELQTLEFRINSKAVFFSYCFLGTKQTIPTIDT